MALYKIPGTIFLVMLTAAVLPAAQDRIAGALDPSRTVVLKGNVHPLTQARNDQGRVDAAMPISYATLHLKPGTGLEEFLAGQQTPGSPDYHRWLTPEQFGERFGLSPADLAKITDWLRGEGFQIHDVARGRHWITFSGTAAQVSRAFHTEIHRYLVNGSAHFANATPLSVPAALANVVSGVRGLDDFRLQPQSKLMPEGSGSSSSGRVLAPDDLATIYDFKRLLDAGIDGTGQTIAIIGQTALHLSDISTFRTRFNLPANTPQVMLFGANPGVILQDLGEADLDLEWVGAVARNATIVYVYSGDVITSAQYAVDQNVAPVMSMSYGGCEAYDSLTVQSIAQQGNSQGITWFVSSGDEGAVTCDRNDATPQATLGTTVSSPASVPEVTAVGGTEFTDTTGNSWGARNDANGASALSYVSEKAWNDFSPTGSISFFATGGGASSRFAKPAWQTGAGVPNDNARDVPDVSLAASETVPYQITYNGASFIDGGTSASSPVMAGIMALVNQHAGGNGMGNINPTLYRLAQATQDIFHDITAGDNKAACEQGSPACINGQIGFGAGTGYDLTTGLGSVDAYNLVMEWSTGTSTFVTMNVSPNTTLNLTDTAQLTATITAAGVPPTGTMTFLSNQAAVGSAPVTASAGGGTATVSVSAALLAAGDGTVTALYSGDTVYNGSKGSAHIALNVPAGAAFVVPFVTPNPVYETSAYANWEFTVGLAEKGGVATNITAFAIGANNDLSLLGSNPKLAANGTLTAPIVSTGLTVPVNRVLSFSGTDANGNKWTQQITVPFLGPLGTQIAPGITLTSPATTVQQNPQVDPSTCPWALPVSLQETGGYPVLLTTFSAGGASLTSQIQTVFGTTRLAPYGVLRGTVCFSGSTPPAAKSLQIAGTTSIATTVTATLAISFAGASTAPATMSTPVKSVSLDSASGNTTASVPVNFAGGVPQFTTSLSPANRTAAWLTVTPGTASGSSPVNLQASATGLSPGVYNAVVSIQAVDALPQVIQIPVTFVVGGSSTTQISAVGNAWSYATTAAPGMLMTVFGTQLANFNAQATKLPLPLLLSGVSATVNGFSAPLQFVSPGQVNLQVPYEAGAGQAVLAISNNGQIASFPFQVAPSAPGVLNALFDNLTGAPVTTVQAGAGQVLLAFVTGEGDVTPTLGTGATPSSTITDPTRLPHSRLPLTLTIGGVAVTPLFAGIPSGIAGATQIDFQVPANVPAGNQPLVVTVGGVASPPVQLNVTAGAAQ